MLPGDRHKSEADKILAAQKLRVSRKLRNNFTKVLSIVLAMLISLPLVQVNAISVDIAQVKSVAASGTNSDLVSVARDKENDVSDLMTITTFEALETPTREYAIKDAPKTQDALGLPEMLAATVNGKKAQVPVTWTADKSYKGALGKTIFTAIPADGYALAQGVQTPIVTVTVTRTGPGTSVTRFVVGEHEQRVRGLEADHLVAVIVAGGKRIAAGKELDLFGVEALPVPCFRGPYNALSLKV